MSNSHNNNLTFWEHIDVLRKMIFRSLAVVVLFAGLAFVYKDFLFSVVLAPSKSDFVTYKIICRLGQKLALDMCPENFVVQLINTQLSSQFLIHLSISFYAGVIVALPYLVYQLFQFVAPALYKNERKYSGWVILFSLLLFLTGVLLNYFIIFPISFRFLSTYQIDPSVPNMINLSSYMDTLTMLSLMIGLMTELPIFAWFLAKIGVLSDTFMRKYRRHVVVVLMIIAAIITPTADVFTLLLVFVPLYLLYELSIVVVRRVGKKKNFE
ncbi:MAG: twin-arginine translocase subunit TatC, partial [Dysgonamonadaceae bacterium]|nr:twin-arginine translocase subunit TatC [Dysgonamonadaceae bacterium]